MANLRWNHFFTILLTSSVFAIGQSKATTPHADAEEWPIFTEHLGAFSEYIIVGAGPGGMQLGAFMEAAGVNYRILERGERVGTFWERFPRHGQLISINKRFTSRRDDEFNWRHDWNSLLAPASRAQGSPRFRDFSHRMFPKRKEYHAYLQAYYRFHQLKVQFKWNVERVKRISIRQSDGSPHAGFSLTSSTGKQLTCKYLVIATSLGRPFMPNMKGIELAERYDELNVDEESYTDQRVLVLGLGNAGFESATRAQNTAGYVHMVGRSHGGLNQAYHTHYVGDVRAINNNILDTFFLKSLDTVDVETDLEKDNCSLHKQVVDGKEEIKFSCGKGDNPSYRDGYDRVISCLGWRYEDKIFDESVKPKLNSDLQRPAGKYPALTDTYRSVNVENMYYAGTLVHSHDWKKSAGGFVHGFRYVARTLHRILQLTNHGKRWEAQRTIPGDAYEVARAMQIRFQNAAGLYQMFGELCDVVMVTHNGATYMEETPLRFITNAAHPPNLRMLFTMHMDYGKKGHNGKGDLSFSTMQVGRAHYSQFLHPIIRAYLPTADTELPHVVSEFHIIEDFLTTWDVYERHLKPLVEWVSRVYAGDYTSQEEMLAARFTELQANLTQEERGMTVKKLDEYYGSFTFHPSVQADATLNYAKSDSGTCAIGSTM